MHALIDTYEYVCSSHPWGHIDPGQVSPHMNNQTQLPSAFANQYLFRQQGSRATIQYEGNAALYTPDHLKMIITMAGIDQGRVDEEESLVMPIS